jgi:hypothetical protein
MIAIAPAEEKSRQESTGSSVTGQEWSTRAGGLETSVVWTHPTAESAVDRRLLRMRWEFDDARGLRMRWEKRTGGIQPAQVADSSASTPRRSIGLIPTR